jgi:hypothetical protein
MKKLIVLFAPMACLTAQNVTINSNGLEKQGIEVRQGSDPYTLQVWNRTNKTILSFSTRLEYDTPRGTRAYGNSRHTGPIAPGARVLVSTGGSSSINFGGSPQPSAGVRRHAGPLSSMDISVESVLFDDYTCIGPDRGHGCEETLAEKSAERDLYRAISTAGNVGDDAVIQALRDAGADKPQLGPPLADAESTYENFYAFYKQRKAQSIFNGPTPVNASVLVARARRNLQTRKYPQEKP